MPGLVQRNFNTDPETIYLGASEEGALRWAKEIANQRGRAETYSLFAVNLDGCPPRSWGGVGKTKFGPQAVVRYWNIPPENVKHLRDVEVAPRRGRKTFEARALGHRPGGRLVTAVSYWMGHRPDEDGPPAHDLLAGGAMPDDIYDRPDYYTGFRQWLPETMRTLRAARGNPGAMITVYRAQRRGTGLNDGDWITLSRDYAELDLESEPETEHGGREVNTYRVPASAVRYAGDDLMEWGYFGPTVGKIAKVATDKTWWHGTPYGGPSSTAGETGVHVGTREAAREALNARIGHRADGQDWDGTQEYGKTLLAGKKTLQRLGRYPTGYSVSVPQEDFYPGQHLDPMQPPMSARPAIFPVKIVGPMSNTERSPHEDFAANGRMKSLLQRGIARKGFYYTNVSEDAGSISAVVPSWDHLQRVGARTASVPVGIPLRNVRILEDRRDTGGPSIYLAEVAPGAPLVYRNIGDRTELEMAVETNEWTAAGGGFTVRSIEGDTQFLASRAEALAWSHPLRREKGGYWLLVTADITGQTVKFTGRPENHSQSKSPGGWSPNNFVSYGDDTGVYHPDIGMGIGVVGEMDPARVIKRVEFFYQEASGTRITKDLTWREYADWWNDDRRQKHFDVASPRVWPKAATHRPGGVPAFCRPAVVR